jgi:hypothetical protein
MPAYHPPLGLVILSCIASSVHALDCDAVKTLYSDNACCNPETRPSSLTNVPLWVDTNPAASTPCADLVGLEIPKERIGLPTKGGVVDAAVHVAADATAGVFEKCVIDGHIRSVSYSVAAEPIKFRLEIPTNWNKKAIHLGGGAFNGFIAHYNADYHSTLGNTNPHEQGYATFGSDSGHQHSGDPIGGVWESGFAIIPESKLNYDHQHIKKTHDAAVYIIAQHKNQEPDRMYWVGGSTGGREGHAAAQRYADDYDGFATAYPVVNLPQLHAHHVHVFHTNLNPPNETKQAVLRDAIIAECDALDGKTDGFIANPIGCKERTTNFKLKESPTNPLRCPGGANTGLNCLSDSDIDGFVGASEVYDLGFKLNSFDSDTAKIEGYPIFSGLYLTFIPGVLTTLTGLMAAPMSALGCYWANDCTADPFTNSNFVQTYKKELLQNYENIATADVDAYAPFLTNGKKILWQHGWNDNIVPIDLSIQLYDKLKAKYPALSSFLRFFNPAGMQHGGNMDLFTPLVAWVEKGEEPPEQIDVDLTASPFASIGSQPACEYPLYSHWTGSVYECRTP